MSITKPKPVTASDKVRLMAIKQGTPEHFSERKKASACGSDLAAMIGVNPYKTPEKHRRICIGEEKEFFSAQDKLAIKHGMEYEDKARDLFSTGMGLNVTQIGILSMDEDDRFKASPDGVIYNKKSSIDAIVEIKCPYRAYKYNEYKGNVTEEDIERAKAIPVYYLPQIYANMKYSGLYMHIIYHTYQVMKRILSCGFI